VKFPTGGMRMGLLPDLRARERTGKTVVSRSGEMPEPTVKVRMKEDEHCPAPRGAMPVIALGERVVTKGDHS
jgi:hypothetical protein